MDFAFEQGIYYRLCFYTEVSTQVPTDGHLEREMLHRFFFPQNTFSFETPAYISYISEKTDFHSPV